MHELAVMRDVVRMIEEVLADAPRVRVRRVSLKVSTRSHVSRVDAGGAARALAAAAAGTRVEGAELELIAVPVSAECRSCGMRFDADEAVPLCPRCGATTVTVEEVPEVVVHELDVE